MFFGLTLSKLKIRFNQSIDYIYIQSVYTCHIQIRELISVLKLISNFLSPTILSHFKDNFKMYVYLLDTFLKLIYSVDENSMTYLFDGIRYELIYDL